ncbi:SRPBCC family protein [Streptoalloteichus hindustanus]|uniref:Polyketide cyclase / dehydrase and lipid transport n=1 Tax=Streptoalloteichus hindustanus TaxID=2017 RepID=A0A1M5AHY8_STRHI|nr:SRPBCC family protein [Streptoalloteichus hindustanus]SHF29881.1 Polyketide cyclase / dehydrase and lipid transport [Streptoalloteichus hindustanus]
MTTIVKSVDVEVPVHTAYNQWTQFTTFPKFMAGVRRVDQLSDTVTHWDTEIAGVHREFDARITEQLPDERIAWRAVDGPEQSGVVTFHRLDDTHTRVHLQMDFEPSGFTELAGTALGLVERRVQGDLDRFKTFIEDRGQETGGWRGHIERPPQAGEARFTEHGPGPVQPPGTSPPR